MAAAKHNAYGPGHAANHVKHHEWRTAENSAAHLVPHLEAMAQAKPDLDLLDVGAGSGTITASLARYMPRGRLTATDISESILDRAAEHARSRGVANVSFQTANVFELPFPDASFDVAHAHQVLCHLDDPAAAIREMLRVTRPGGLVALRESDMRMWCFWPELPSLAHFHDIQVRTIVANGGQDKAGRRLVSWILSTGVDRADVEASCGTWCYSEADDRKAWGNFFLFFCPPRPASLLF